MRWPTSARRARWPPGWPARRQCSTRRCVRASRAWSRSSASRTRRARRACWMPCAAPMRRSRASGGRVTAPASCSRPTSTRATSSPSRSCAAHSSAKRRLPRQGDPGLELGRRRGRARTRARPRRGARAASRGPLAARGALFRGAAARTGLRRARTRGRADRLHGARCAGAQARRRGARARPRARAAAARPPSARRGARGGRMTKNWFRRRARGRETSERPATFEASSWSPTQAIA